MGRPLNPLRTIICPPPSSTALVYLALHHDRMAPSVLARDIAAYSDAELDRYLEESRIEGGAMVVNVKDPENIPESFIRRLR